jgi:hypothetical protein
MSGSRSVVASVVAILLVATAVGAVWLIAGAGVFASSSPNLDGPLAAVTETPPGVGSGAGLPLAAGFQVSQPRDPFKPLTSEPPTTSSTIPGETTTTVPGQTTTTVPGQTTTTEGFQPEATRIVLLEIREENGVRKAVVSVDGVTYVVGVGETFAGNFKVVSLSENSGVFQYGDTAFTLAVGQAILK